MLEPKSEKYFYTRDRKFDKQRETSKDLYLFEYSSEKAKQRKQQ